MGSREQPWARSPETALGFRYRLSPAFQVAAVVTIEFRAPILSLPGLRSVGGDDGVATQGGIKTLGQRVKGQPENCRTEKGPLKRLWGQCSRSSLEN